jgi:hypothetical protein
MEKIVFEKMQKIGSPSQKRNGASPRRGCRGKVQFRVIGVCLTILLLMTACQPGPEDLEDLTSPPFRLTATAEIGTQPLTTVVQEQQMVTPDLSWKVASSVQQRLVAIDQALAAGMTDVSELSDNLLHVRSNGAIELVFHAATSVSQVEESELEALGAEIVISTAGLTWPEQMQPPAGLGQIQAWLPYDRVYEAAQLGWVTAVTPPDYGYTD